MKQNNVIELNNYRKAEPFDFEAYNRRAEVRFRSSEIRAWITQIIDSAVTVAIGACSLFCAYLVFLMM